MGEGDLEGESVRMAPEIQAIKEMEELKTEISIDHTAMEKPPAVEEPSTGEGTVGISLIDLAEILDQHKQWVESGAETGARADLTGVNLAKADLTGLTPVRSALAPVSDRKSTRLNSSHPSISYAVFCLKKKKTKRR